MTVESHELADDFPQFKEQIHRLKAQNAHFAKLAEKYHAVARQIKRVEQEVETVSDEFAEMLKKKRLKLKDELLALLKKEAA